jgi:hypothetical protein
MFCTADRLSLSAAEAFADQAQAFVRAGGHGQGEGLAVDVEMAQFKESLGQKLEALQLPQGTQVKIWVMNARPAAMSGIILAKPVCGS